MNTLAFVVHRAARHWQLLLTVSLGVVLATGLLASGPLLIDTATELALQHTLATAEVLDGNLRLSTRLCLAQADPTAPAALDAQARSMLQEHVGDYLEQVTYAVESPWMLPWLRGELLADQRVNFGFYEGAADHVVLVAGDWPTRTATAEVVPALISEEMASAYGLDTGDRLPLSLQADDPGPTVWLEVSGIARPLDPTERYWFGGYSPFLAPEDPRWAAQYTAVLAAESFYPAVRSLFALGGCELSWQALLLPERIATDDIPLLQERITALRTDLLPTSPSLTLQTDLDDTLERFAVQSRAARPPLYILTAEIVLLVLYYVTMVAALSVNQVEREFATLGSRGASGWQVLRIQLTEAGLIGAVAFASGPGLAALLIRLLVAVGPLADVRTAGWALRIPQGAWLAAGVGVVACTIGLLLPAVPAARRGIVAHQQARARAARSPWWQRMYLDVFALLVSLILLWRLQLYGGFAPDAVSNGRVDWLLLLSPVVLLLASATILLRVFPLVLRLLAGLASRARGLPGALAMWQAARNPTHVARLVLLLTLAMALGILSTGLTATLDTSESERARYAAGSDWRLAAAQSIPFSTLTTIPGVHDVARVWRGSGTAMLGSYRSLQSMEVLALEPDSFAAVTTYRDDFATQPVDELLDLLAADDESDSVTLLPLPGRPVRLGVWLWAPADEEAPAANLREVYQLNGNDDLDRIELQAKIFTAQNEVFTVRLTLAAPDVRLDGWGYFHAILPDLPPSSYPLSLHSLWVQNRARNIYGTSYEFVIIPMWLQMDDLTVVDRQTGELTVVEDFERPSPIWGMTDPVVGYAGGGAPFIVQYNTSEAAHSGQAQLRLMLDFYRSLQMVRLNRLSGRFSEPTPVLVNATFLDTTHIRPGDVIEASFNSSQPISLRIAGAVQYFPTLYESRPASSRAVVSNFLIAPLDVLLNQLNGITPRPINANEAWLSADPQLPYDQLVAAVPTAERVWEAEAIRQAMKAYPLGLGLRSVTFFGYALTSLLSLVGFATYFYMSARQREVSYGVLRSIGLSPFQLYGSLVLEQVALILFGLAFGTLLGAALNQLVLPRLPISFGDYPPIPPFRPQENWAAVGRVYLTLTLAFLGSLGVATALLLRARIHRALRIEQE